MTINNHIYLAVQDETSYFSSSELWLAHLNAACHHWANCSRICLTADALPETAGQNNSLWDRSMMTINLSLIGSNTILQKGWRKSNTTNMIITKKKKKKKMPTVCKGLSCPHQDRKTHQRKKLHLCSPESPSEPCAVCTPLINL